MNPNQIESLLRRAPAPAAPADLRQQLLAGIRPPRTEDAPSASIRFAPLWRRWFPALSFGLLFLGCLIVLGVQTRQLLVIRAENSELRVAGQGLEQLRRDNLDLQQHRAARDNEERLRKENEELIRLRAEVAELRSRAQDLSMLLAENQRLKAERAAALTQAGAIAENDPFAQAKEKALATACISNLKQIGLAGRVWANNHKTTLLPVDWLLMKKELSTPKILTCPADTARTPAISWDEFDGSSVSYEFPSARPDEQDPYTVYTRCRIHGQVGLTDGSAHMGIKPERLQQVDDNLKLRNDAGR